MKKAVLGTRRFFVNKRGSKVKTFFSLTSISLFLLVMSILFLFCIVLWNFKFVETSTAIAVSCFCLGDSQFEKSSLVFVFG